MIEFLLIALFLWVWFPVLVYASVKCGVYASLAARRQFKIDTDQESNRGEEQTGRAEA